MYTFGILSSMRGSVSGSKDARAAPFIQTCSPVPALVLLPDYCEATSLALHSVIPGVSEMHRSHGHAKNGLLPVSPSCLEV